jgi:RNA polymerase sigma factor (sigma-70 family)
MDLGARIAEHRTYLIRRAIWLGVAPQDAEDIVGDVVVTALSKAGEFVDINLRGWLNIILGFHFKHYRRKQLRRRREFGLVGDGEDGLEIAFDIPVPGSQLPALQLGEALRALASLPERDRDIIETVTICGMTYADYAAKCAIPIGTVKSRLSRAHEVFQSRVAEGAGAHRAAPASAKATPRARQSTAVDTRAAERRAPAAAGFPPAAQDRTPRRGARRPHPAISHPRSWPVP